MARDWAAVSEAMKARMAELDMTQADLVQQSGLAPMTIREILFNTADRRRSPQTLAALSSALGWPAGHLQSVVQGRAPADPEADDPVLTELAVLKDAIGAINRRLDSIEQQLADDDGQPSTH
jgi:transcriptional regulator with XRE-family HTH domain